MYIESVPNRSSPPAILLRESFRLDGKVKKRTLANLSHWPSARVEALRRALRGEFDLAPSSPLPDPVCGPVFGLLFALKQIADEIGLSAALGRSRLARLGLFLVLARVAHQGSRLSAARWAQDHAVAETLGLGGFDEDDLYAALDDLCARQQTIEQDLFRLYLERRGAPPALFLYDVTSSYLEGHGNALAAYGYNRDGKRGKLQIVIGLLADAEGEPLAVRVFAGNTSDPLTVAEQIAIVKQQFGVEELVFVGDRGMVKSKGKRALSQAGLRYITALTDPQIRKLLHAGTLQLGLFDELIHEVENEGLRYVLRHNALVAERERRRLDDKLAKLSRRLAARNEKVAGSPRCDPEAGLRALAAWAKRHKLKGLIELRLDQRRLVLEHRQEAIERALELAGCYVLVSDVPSQQMSARELHQGYVGLQKVERDFRQIKTGLLEVRPVFVRKQSRTRGHVFCCLLALKLSREIERRLQAVFGTTDSDPHTLTLADALAALSRLCLLNYEVDESTTVTKLPRPDERQEAILAALRVRLPPG